MIPTIEEFAAQSESWLGRTGLPPSTRLLAWLSAANAMTFHRPTQWILESALARGIPVLHLREVILQNHLFCGFPAAIEGLIILKNVLKHHGVPDDHFVENRTENDIMRDGMELCRRVYGRNFDKLASHMRSLSPDLYDWMIRDGYGKVLSRSVLPVADRELCVVSSLAALRRERQLIAHMRGALHLGATEGDVVECLESLRLLVDEETVRLAVDVFRQSGTPGKGHTT